MERSTAESGIAYSFRKDVESARLSIPANRVVCLVIRRYQTVEIPNGRADQIAIAHEMLYKSAR